MAKLIPLSGKHGKGLCALVDDEDFVMLGQWKWFVTDDGYVRATGRNPKRTLLMHRVVIRATDGCEIDHINGDKLDCRKENLRQVTRSQNVQNTTKKTAGTTSKYKGVHKHRSCNRWEATITVNGKKIYLGLFKNELDAAKAYDKAAHELYGLYAKVNFK